MNRFRVLAVSVFAVFMLAACGGSEPPAPQEGAGQASPHGDIPPVGKPVVEVPDVVKGKWKGVVLVVEDKEKGGASDYSVDLGSKFKIPGSDIVVEVKEFFPSFVMQGSSITSTSNEPNNPAAQVVISEGGSEIFSGWLFARYPTTHAFSHQRFALTLKEGMAK